MDFMNLNQSAHGDREFGFICTRLRLNRKVVVGHWQDEAVQRRGRRLDAGGVRLGRRRRRLKVARFGDNMREVAVTEGDKVEAQRQFGYSVNGYGVGDLVEVIDEVTDAEIDALCSEYASSTRARTARGEAQQASLREQARIETGHAPLPGGGRLRRLHRHLRGPARPRAAARARRAAADGRRLRLRRRRRLEDRGARARDEGDGARAEGRHVASWRTTPTTSTPRARRCWARTCSRSAPRSPRASPPRGAPARHRRQGRPGPAGVRRAPRARRSTPRWSTWATASA